MNSDFFDYIDSDRESCAWKTLARGGSLVEAIKSFRSQYGAGLKEAKDVVEEYNNRRRQQASSATVIAVHGGELFVTRGDDGFYDIMYAKKLARLSEAKVMQAIADYAHAAAVGEI